MTVTDLVAQNRVDHTYTSGFLSSSSWVDSCDGTEILSVADHDVDPSTGLIAASRNPSGVAADFGYDLMGRLTSERPESGAWIHYRYQVPTTSQPSLPLRLTVETGDAGHLPGRPGPHPGGQDRDRGGGGAHVGLHHRDLRPLRPDRAGV